MSQSTAERPRSKVSKPRSKPARTIKVSLPPSETTPFYVLTVTERTPKTSKSDVYFVHKIPTPLGRGFEVRKAGADEPYQVLLERDGRSCTCKGHLRWGHCRHADGLQALVAAGKLDA